MPLSSRKVGIIAAVEAEVADIIANPVFNWNKVKENQYTSPHNLELIVSGIGKVNVTYALAQIIHTVDEVLIMGTSGGLSNQEVGAVYLSTEFVEHDMNATGLGFAPGITPFSWMTEAKLANADPESISEVFYVFQKLGVTLHVGKTISGDQFLNNPEVVAEKIRLFNGELVDMESAAVAKICIQEKKPFMALRYVSDNANHEAHTSWLEQVTVSSRIMNTFLMSLKQLSV